MIRHKNNYFSFTWLSFFYQTVKYFLGACICQPAVCRRLFKIIENDDRDFQDSELEVENEGNSDNSNESPVLIYRYTYVEPRGRRRFSARASIGAWRGNSLNDFEFDNSFNRGNYFDNSLFRASDSDIQKLGAWRGDDTHDVNDYENYITSWKNLGSVKASKSQSSKRKNVRAWTG